VAAGTPRRHLPQQRGRGPRPRVLVASPFQRKLKRGPFGSSRRAATAAVKSVNSEGHPFLPEVRASNERNVSISTTPGKSRVLTWRSTTSRELTAIVSQAQSDAAARVTA
jgi:hypothetical protein